MDIDGAVSDGDRGQMHEHLLELQQSVNKWLEFAEKKNSTGLTLSSAALAVIIGFDRKWGGPAAVVFGSSIALLVLGVGASALSFLPKMRIEGRRVARAPAERESILYYGHLAEYDHRELIKAIYERYLGVDVATHDRYAEDLAAQIVVNASITVRKLQLFRLTVILFAAGTLLGMASLLLGTTG